METLPSPETITAAHQAVEGLRRVLYGLGADADLTRLVDVHLDADGHRSVYIPPLPLPMAEHLVRLLPTGAGS